ncbi:MAG TPA: MmcQ/YjbR family DNA-binding protein [Vulgatibacter sp.]
MADEDLKRNPHLRELRDFALAFPEAHEAFPWGHRVIKVREKGFVFIGGEDGNFGISVKLPQSAEAALSLPFTEPTGYGLGKSGWVSARFTAGEGLPVPILRAWIEESYRAVAPKTLVKSLDGPGVVRAAGGGSAGKWPTPNKSAPAAKKKAASAGTKKSAPVKERAPAGDRKRRA